jgi:iron complex outermembrane receptor protein
MKTLTWRGLLMAVALAAPMAAFAEVAGEISGTVKDPSGGVIAGASVTLRDLKGASLQEVKSDARGSYSFKGVAPGPYTLFVFREGFVPVTDEVRVDGGPATRDITLKVAGFAEEVTVSFTGEQARTALKMDAPVRDVPLSVASYTTSFVKALDARNAGDLYTYMNGVNRTGLGVTDAAVRGFTMNVEGFNVALNGMPGNITRNNASSTENLERIELLKGPASVLYGKASPGGLINIISKRPQAQPGYMFNLRLGSFAGTGPGFGDANSYRVSTDLTGPIGNHSRLLYRLIGSFEHARSFRDFVKADDVYITPSVTWNIASDSVLTIEGEYRHNDGSFDSGLIAPQNDISLVAPITTRYQEPDDLQTDGGWSVTGYFTKAFSGGWGLNVNWRTALQNDERSGFESNSVLADARTVRRRDRDQINNRGSHFLDSTLSKSVRTGGMSHAFLTGLMGGHNYTEGDRRRFNNLGFNIDLYNPVYGLYAKPADPRPDTYRGLYRWDYSGYLQDRVDFGHGWKGLFALRYDRWDVDYKPLRLPDVTPPGSRTDIGWLPMGGLVFQPDTRWSLYGSVSTSFEPIQNISDINPITPDDFKPERGRQFETGVKAELAGGRVDTTLAFFDIVKNNVNVPLSANVTIQTGQQHSRGLEADLRLKPTEHFQAIFGYTYTDAKISKDTRPQLVGNRLLNVAKHSANVWGRYDVSSGTGKGLGFGLGLIYRGDRSGSVFLSPSRLNGPAFVLLPEYFRADAALYFVRGRAEITLRGNNLFDRIYYEASNSTTGILPGRPREITLSLRTRL